MFVSTSIFHRPIATLSILKSPIFRSSKSPTSHPVSSNLCVPKNLGFWENQFRYRRSMSESITVSESNGEEGIGALEHESFITQSNPLTGFEATLNHLSKWLMVALFSSVLLLRHDAKAIWIAMGAILNIGLSVTLKKILNQERPSTASKSDPGMPSSHAQSIFFIILVVILSMMDWLGTNIYTTPLAGLLLAFGSYFTWLRVSQGFHTISQVVVGAVAGSIFCSLWFWLWDAIVLEAFNSSLWIRLLVVAGGVGCVLRFTLIVIQDWIINEN